MHRVVDTDPAFAALHLANGPKSGRTEIGGKRLGGRLGVLMGQLLADYFEGVDLGSG